MMNYSRGQKARTASIKSLFTLLAGSLLLGLGGCEGPDAEDGTVVNDLVLPTDTLMNLACEDAGIAFETCILNDPENPFSLIVINEFDVNNPTAANKFDIANSIPAGPTGAKARAYFWATALARRATGENQWFTARAFHELYDANSDPLIQNQALKAYRSVLDNFFGSVVFFECCANVNPSGNPVAFSIPLNELTADDIYRTDATGFTRLVPGDPLLALALLAEWGYTYQPATPPNFDNGVVTINEG